MKNGETLGILKLDMRVPHWHDRWQCKVAVSIDRAYQLGSNESSRYALFSFSPCSSGQFSAQREKRVSHVQGPCGLFRRTPSLGEDTWTLEDPLQPEWKAAL